MNELNRLLRTTLDDASLGIEEFHRAFMVCGARFEQGQDSPALAEFGNLLPRLSDFSHFCLSLDHACASLFPDAPWREQFEALRQRFSAILTAMTAVLREGDFLALGETLRLDLCPVLHAYARLFATVRAALGVDAESGAAVSTAA